MKPPSKRCVKHVTAEAPSAASTEPVVRRLKNFSFLIPGVLAGSGYPEGDPREVVEQLRSRGIKTVVNLTEHEHPASAEIRRAGMNSIHMPVADFYCPTPRQMELAAEIVLQVENRPVLFHCALGMGRTGVMLVVAIAALRHGNDPCVASQDPLVHPVQFVRSLRRGSIHSRVQMKAANDFVELMKCGSPG